MGRYSVKRYKTKRYTRDLDQILHDDLGSEKSIEKLEHQPYDETKPGLGQFYCTPCAKYFETELAKRTHLRGKIHKRQVKDLKEGPYTVEEANAAAGLDVARYLKKKEEQKETLNKGTLPNMELPADKKKEKEFIKEVEMAQ